VGIPGAVIQAGVDAQLISNGMTAQSHGTFVLTGTNTGEASHTYNLPQQTVTIHVDNNGQAQPLNVTINLPDTIWHPTSDAQVVAFDEKSFTIVATINISGLGDVVATFTCAPHGTAQFIALARNGPPPPPPPPPSIPPPPTTPGSSASPTTAAGGTTNTTAFDPSAHPSGSGTSHSLPFTGAETLLLLVVAAAALDIGIVLIGATRRRLHQR
jgi:hypothetical protein